MHAWSCLAMSVKVPKHMALVLLSHAKQGVPTHDVVCAWVFIVHETHRWPAGRFPSYFCQQTY